MRVDSADLWSTPKDEPLWADEWRVLADWMQHYPAECGRLAAQGDQALTRAVRQAFAHADATAAAMLALNPSLSLRLAQMRCRRFLSRPPFVKTGTRVT